MRPPRQDRLEHWLFSSDAGCGTHGKSDCSTGYIPVGLADDLSDDLARTGIVSSINDNARGESNSDVGRGSRGKSNCSTDCTPDRLPGGPTRTGIDSSIDGGTHSDFNKHTSCSSHGTSDASRMTSTSSPTPAPTTSPALCRGVCGGIRVLRGPSVRWCWAARGDGQRSFSATSSFAPVP